MQQLSRRFGRHLLTIYNAILLEHRVLFFADKSVPVCDMVTCVLSACALLCPPLHGLLRRTFPYASLTDIDFVKVPGYVLARSAVCRQCGRLSE